MFIRFVILCVTLLFISVSNVYAEIYTCKDVNGNTVYTDSPGGCANAEEIKVDTLPTLVPSKSLSTSNRNTSTVKEEDKSAYNMLEITSPSNDSTVRDNQGNITINFRAAPALQSRKGHKYVVTVDGAEVYTGTSTIAALKNVDRGTHSIIVKIIDAAGSTKISSAPVKFTLQRFSALNNVNSNSPDANAGSGNANTGENNNSSENSEGSQTTITNQKFPGNTKFNRPATPPPTQ